MLHTMAAIQKSCSIARILIRFSAGTAFRSLEIELVVLGGVLGQVSISWQWKTQLIYTTTYFLSSLWSFLGCTKFSANLVTKTSIFWTLVSKTLLLAFNSPFTYNKRNQRGYHNIFKINKNQHKNSLYFVLKVTWNLLTFNHFWN